MTAQLPRELETTYVNTMRPGEVRYAHPSAVHVKPDRSLWLYDNTEVLVESSEFHSMRIELLDDGYHVWLVPKHTYKIDPSGLPAYIERSLVPVQEIHFDAWD